MTACGILHFPKMATPGQSHPTGSTYNVMLPEFIKIYDYFKSGQLDKALATQMKVNKIIDVMLKFVAKNAYFLENPVLGTTKTVKPLLSFSTYTFS